MDYTSIVENGNLLFVRYKALSLMELALYLWDLVEYYILSKMNLVKRFLEHRNSCLWKVL